MVFEVENSIDNMLTVYCPDISVTRNISTRSEPNTYSIPIDIPMNILRYIHYNKNEVSLF